MNDVLCVFMESECFVLLHTQTLNYKNIDFSQKEGEGICIYTVDIEDGKIEAVICFALGNGWI